MRRAPTSVCLDVSFRTLCPPSPIMPPSELMIFQDAVSSYLVNVFRAMLGMQSMPCRPARDSEEWIWSDELEEDLMHAALVLSHAWIFEGP